MSTPVFVYAAKTGLLSFFIGFALFDITREANLQLLFFLFIKAEVCPFFFINSSISVDAFDDASSILIFWDTKSMTQFLRVHTIDANRYNAWLPMTFR